MINYHKKYLKYKLKYLNLKKNMTGGSVMFTGCSPTSHHQGNVGDCWTYAVASLIRQQMVNWSDYSKGEDSRYKKYWEKLGIMGQDPEPIEASPESKYSGLPTHDYIREYLKTPDMNLIKIGLEPWIGDIYEDRPQDTPSPESITSEVAYDLFIKNDTKRIGAFTKEIRAITLKGLRIWLPDFNWNSIRIPGSGNILKDIGNLCHRFDRKANSKPSSIRTDHIRTKNLCENLGGKAQSIPFIIMIYYWRRTMGSHAVTGFLSEDYSEIYFKNSHGETTPTIFKPEEHSFSSDDFDYLSRSSDYNLSLMDIDQILHGMKYSFLIFEPIDEKPNENFWTDFYNPPFEKGTEYYFTHGELNNGPYGNHTPPKGPTRNPNSRRMRKYQPV